MQGVGKRLEKTSREFLISEQRSTCKHGSGKALSLTLLKHYIRQQILKLGSFLLTADIIHVEYTFPL